MIKFKKINELDNVAIALEDINKGYYENGITALDNIPFGHKILLTDMKKNDTVIKYGNPIGHLKCNVKAGSHIHMHNLATDLNESFDYEFGGNNKYLPTDTDLTFNGYLRDNGQAGTRNEVWIIPTVGCVNSTVRSLELAAQSVIPEGVDGVFAFTHPYGCSQMGDDQEYTRKALSKLVNHPNAGAVLVVSLGCENTNVDVLKKYIGDYDENRVKFLVTQKSNNEIEEGIKLISQLCAYAVKFKRQPLSVNKLKIGFKCGGSDAFSGITANPLCGRLCDTLTSYGAACILTEVPEMFGAENLLLQRAENKSVFDKAVNMINSFKDYYKRYNQVCYENPSPGNHDGGITTLEEKSLGCVQKGGNSVITDVLEMYQSCKLPGLNLLSGPGNDIVSTTNLTCSGANLILFTTGRGTPLGAPVPTVKLASNSLLATAKPNWIDIDASNSSLTDLIDLIIKTASGNKTKNEINNYREIAIFKDGVTL